MIIPFSAGGSHDLNARIFSSILPTYLGQPVIVKLMPGASGLEILSKIRANPLRADTPVIILTAKGQQIGAIGVSGASAEQDGVCAQVAVDAVKADLK